MAIPIPHRQLFIDGEWKEPAKGNRIPIINPANETVIGDIPAATAEDVDLAVEAARRALYRNGGREWARASGATRAKYLRSIASKIRERTSELAKLEALDSGKPLDETAWDLDDVASCFEYYADLAESLDGKQKTPVSVPLQTFKSYVIKEPIGVVGLITPWNYPLLMATWKVAPALAAGCTAVLKPSELASVTCLELAEVCKEVGLPSGVLNIITGLGSEAGAPLASHPLVDKIAFTGSTETGRKIMTAAAQLTKPVSLELGGKSPLLVFEDVDIEKAVEWTVFGCFWTNGQICSATSRLLLQVKIVRDSMSRMLEVWKEIPEKDLDLRESQSSSYLKEIGGDRRCLPDSVNGATFASRKRRIPICRSSPNAVTPIVTAKKIEIDGRRNSRMVNEKKGSDWRVEIDIPDAGSEDRLTSSVKSCQQERTENNGRSRLEVKRALFEKNWEDKKIGGFKSGSRIVPFEETGSSEVMNETAVVSEKFHGEQKDADLSLIRMQLVQIENQQSSLLNLLQRFIGSSQKGIHSLEARVLNLEIALDNMSRDIVSTSTGRVMNNDRVAKMCCRLPGTEFLSSKFWRRAESTYAPRFLTYKQGSQKFGLSGGFINPLAEVSPQVLGNTTRYNGTKVG